MGLFWTLRLFSFRHLAACPAIPLLLYPSRYAVRFFSVPCFQRLSRKGVALSVKDGRGELPGPRTVFDMRTLHRTSSSRALTRDEAFSDGPVLSSEVIVSGEDEQAAGKGRWLKDSRRDHLDLPGDDDDRAFSMQLINRRNVECDEKKNSVTGSTFFGVTKEKLELRSHIVRSILRTILNLHEVTLVGSILNDWLRNYASRVAIISTLDNVIGNVDRQNNHNLIGRFVPYSQIARIVHSVLQDLGRLGHLEAALEVLRWMEGQGWCQLDPHMYTSIIASLSEAGSFELVEKIFEGLENSHVEKDPALFNAMLHARGKAGQIDSLEDLFEFMKHGACKPDLVTYNTVMNSYVKSGMGLGTVVDVFRDMYSQGIDPDLVSFDILLQACISGRHVKEALKIFENLKKKGLKPSVVTYTTLITLCANSGHSTRALQLLNEMVAENCHPNVQTFSSLITACGRDGNVEEAERVFQAMRESGLEPNVITYNSMIDVYGKGGNCAMALEKYKELELAGFKPTAVTITSLMSCLKAAEKYAEGIGFYDLAKMESICNEHVFSEAIDTYIKWGKLQSVKGVQVDMVSVNCSPNVFTYSIILSALGSRCSSAEDAGVLVNFLKGFDSELAVNACRMLLERMNNDEEVLHHIHRLFSILHKDELRTWTVFTSGLVDALWALGWYRRAALVVAWVMEKGIFEGICVIHPREWKLDLRRLSSGTALVTLYQWFGHLVIVARHVENSKNANSMNDLNFPVSADKEDTVSAACDTLLGNSNRGLPVNVELLLPLLPALPESRASDGLQADKASGDFPPLVTVVTGWGKMSKQEGSSIVKTLVQKEILKLRAPFRPSVDSGRWISTGDLLIPWLLSPATATGLALSDLAAEVDSAQPVV